MMNSKIILIALIIFIFCSCRTKKSESETKTTDSTSITTLSGEYECYAGAVDEAYRYYKLTLTENGDSLSGTFFAGNYLSKNDQGFYSMPAATVTSSLTGQRGNGNEVMLYLGNAIANFRMDSTYTSPQPDKIFDADANADPVKAIYKKGGDFLWPVNGDTLFFSRITQAVEK